jgi:hypothetical protein
MNSTEDMYNNRYESQPTTNLFPIPIASDRNGQRWTGDATGVVRVYVQSRLPVVLMVPPPGTRLSVDL